MVLVFEEEVIRVICAYAPQVGRSESKKDQFDNNMASEGDLQSPDEVVLGMGASTDMLGNGLMILRVCIVGMELAKEMLRKEDYLRFENY